MPKIKFSVYQLDTEQEIAKTARLLFLSYDRLVKETGGPVPKVLYKLAYDGTFNAAKGASDNEILERLFREVNGALAEQYGKHTRGLSCSDVVELPSGAWYCDSVGWKKIDWETSPCPVCNALELCREYSGNLTCEEVLERYDEERKEDGHAED